MKTSFLSLYLSFHEVWGRGRRVLRNCDDWVRRCVRLTVKSTLFPLYSSVANVPTTRDWSESYGTQGAEIFCISILFMPFLDVCESSATTGRPLRFSSTLVRLQHSTLHARCAPQLFSIFCFFIIFFFNTVYINFARFLPILRFKVVLRFEDRRM